MAAATHRPTSHVHQGGCCEAPRGNGSDQGAPSFSQLQVVTTTVTTIALAFFALQVDPVTTLVGFAVGAVMGATPHFWGIVERFYPANGGCTGGLSVMSQSDLPWVITLIYFARTTYHHLEHDMIYPLGVGFCAGILAGRALRNGYDGLLARKA